MSLKLSPNQMGTCDHSVTYRYQEFFFFLVVLVVSEKFGTIKSIGTSIGKSWYRKKVSEPVSEKVGTGKKCRNRYRKIWYGN